jgi:hypothetical protein
MAANVQQINVASPEELEGVIMSYIAQGFAVSNRTAESVTLFKKKEFNVIWAIVGFFLCLLPLLVYCIVYATQDDEMVVVRVGALPLALGASGEVKLSDDRQWWWDGARWRDTEVESPPAAKLSEDGQRWWDGVDWRPMPTHDKEAGSPPLTGEL